MTRWRARRSRTGFDPARAAEHLRQIARAPRPLASAGHDQARSYLAEVLAKLGLEVHEDTRTVTRVRPDGHAQAGRVTNVHARRSQDSGPDRLLLVAHYDSVPGGPGAADDGVGVATLLELARLLADRAEARNRIELLFTDGEEVGLLGATAAAGAMPDGRTLVLNIDARGSSGPVVMFETGAGAGHLVRALRHRPPVATSVGEALYRCLPHDTDFSVLRRAGCTGMNFAVVDGSARYHTATDHVDGVGGSVLADLGEVIGSAVPDLAQLDLGRLDDTSTSRLTVLGRLIHYPARAERLLAAASAATTLLTLWRSRGHRTESFAAAGRAAAALPLPVLASAGTATAAWRLARVLRPHFSGFSTGDPYRPAPARAGLTAIACGMSLSAARRLRRRHGPEAISDALQTWLSGGGLALSWAAPGVAHLVTWPGLIGGAGRLTGTAPQVAGPISLALLAAPLIRILHPGLGLRLAAVPAALTSLTTLGVANCLPRTAFRDFHGLDAGTALTLAGAGLWALGVARETADEKHPAQISLLYAADLDRAEAFWLADPACTHPWVRQHAPMRPRPFARRFPALTPAPFRHGAAPALTTAGPSADVVDRTGGADGETHLAVRFRPGEVPARLTTVFARSPNGHLRGAQLAGTDIPPRTGDEISLAMAAPAEEGFVVRFTLTPGARLDLTVLTHIDLPETLLRSPQPGNVTWSARNAGQGLLARTFTLT